ncbi:hypothetical protein [Paractinoplanes ferrugineus]|uniref:hypothetical protein n=1 Tax=Paractinoplanes ferrugineus TaxID=113564 RepID=UPI0019450BFB|nr:hypothetical protein [Actinoplanes ferrugineus]
MSARVLRSLVLVPWLVACSCGGEQHAGTAVPARALGRLWIFALLPDRHGHRTHRVSS